MMGEKWAQILYLVILATVIGSSTAQNVNCSDFSTNCLSCAGAGDGQACGWCGTTMECLPGTKEKPSDGRTCIGTWSFLSKQCRACDVLGDCYKCMDNPSCCWDDMDKSCNLLGVHGLNCTRMGCPCEPHLTCTDCVFKKACKWCDGGNQFGHQCIHEYDQSCRGPIEEQCSCHQHDCDGCLRTAGCIWCAKKGAESHVCVQAPDAECQLDLTCESYCAEEGKAGCHTCNQLNGCGWCPETNECVDYGQNACEIRHICEVEECPSFTDCQTCNLFAGCAWCDDPGVCIDPYYNDKNCYYKHSCAVDSTNFNFASFVGGMFSVVVLGLVGATGYIAYKRNKDKAAYENLENSKL